MLITGLTTNYLNAQGSWTLQTNPIGSGESAMLGKVQFVSATEGWISTSNSGDLLHTTNAGITWSLVPTSGIDIVTSSSDPSGGLSFINETTGWVMKMFGDINNPLGAVVYKTTDRGVNWQKQIISETVGDGGFQLQFFDANNGWASVINFPSSIKYYKTTNGGSSWNLISTDNSWKICHFIDTNNGWAIDPWFFNQTTSSKIYHTTNGGASWVMQYEDPLKNQYHAIQFTDLNNGWVVGENGKILKTTDGGLHWTPFTNTGITTEYFNNCIYFMNATTGWIGSRHNNTEESAKILHTNDGGINWTIQDTNYPNGNIFSIYFGDENNGWFTGDSGIIGHYSAVNTYPSIGIVGDATSGWETDIAMNTTDGITYKITAYTFKNGGAKFRQDNTWTINWGSNTFPSGTGTQNGVNIPVIAGTYNVTFNRLTGDYAFSTGNYSNATLNGSWFFYTEPLNPYDDQLNYAIFDGNGNITGASGFPAPAKGNYTVNQNGSFSGNAIMGGESFPFSGQLTSQNGGTINFGDGVNTLSKIPNPGALQDKIIGELRTENYGTKNVTLNIDSQGNIISATGLTPPVSGNVYTDLGVFIGHLKTGDAVPWNELTIMGYNYDNDFYGQLALDCENDEGITSCQLIRRNNPPDNTDWKLQLNPAEATTEVGKIQFVTATEGWISISPGGLLHTTNGGVTWKETPLDLPNVIISSMIDPAFNMCFINPLTGWVLKSFGTDPFDSNGAVVYKTTNGGLNWQKIILSQVPKDMGGQIQFIDENNGYASIVNTESGLAKYYKTTDGGTTWSLLPSDGTVGIFYPVDLNNSWGILGTFSQTPPFKILHSNNGMASFTEQSTDDSPGAFWALQFTDLNHGWVVGQKGKILKTDNGGLKWDPVTNTGITSDYTCKSVYFMNATTGWIGAQLDNSSNKIIASTNYAIVLHTKDGGASWTTQTTPTFNPYSIFFWDTNNGWLTSDDNQIAGYTAALGIKENIVNKYLTIYPNPNTGTFYFRLKDTNSKIQIEIFTISGQKVYEASNMEKQTTNEVNFSPQSKGVYLIKIDDGQNSYSEKIMIK